MGNITNGLGRRIFLSFAVTGAILASNVAFSSERYFQTQKSIKEVMLSQGFDLETDEAKRLVREYKLKNALKPKQQQQEGANYGSENKSENNVVSTVNRGEAEIKLVNLKTQETGSIGPKSKKINQKK